PPALPQPDVAVAVPCAALGADVQLAGEIQDVALPGDALAVKDVKFGFPERRRDLVLAPLYPGAAAHGLVPLFERLDPPDVHADRGVEFESSPARRHFGRAEHDADLLPDLVGE